MSDPLKSLERLRYQPRPGRWEALAASAPPPRRSRAWLAPVLLAAAAAFLWVLWPREAHFDMSVASGAHTHAERLSAQWFETAADEHATVQVADIGTVKLEPDSRIRLVATSATQHRLELSRGVLHASVTAPPRLFVVETPQATAVDLGCAYTLRVTEAGTELTVESGLVALEGAGRTSTVLEGMRALSRKTGGPTPPLALDASRELRDAVDAFDATGEVASLEHAFGAARLEDAATLWHLLPAAPVERRAEFGKQLAALVPPPRTWVPELGGSDPELMRQWWGELVRRRK